jgi:hypothetical protein
MQQLAVYRIGIKDRIGLPETIEKLSPDGYFLQPMIDRAGDKVVFWGRQEDEVGYNIWRWDSASQRPVALTTMSAVSGHPFWSVDAKHIVFFSTFGLSSETEWSMENQFELNRSPRNIWIMESNGDGCRKLTEGPHVDERPCISPDGECVVFVSDRSGSMNLWSVSVGTGKLEQMTRHDGMDYRPVFSPDGSSLAFFTTNNAQGMHDLCIMGWPDGEPDFPLPPGRFTWAHGPFWLADGESLLFHGVPVGESHCAIWVLHLHDRLIERIELPGVPSYAHGSLDADESILAFDSSVELRAPKNQRAGAGGPACSSTMS